MTPHRKSWLLAAVLGVAGLGSVALFFESIWRHCAYEPFPMMRQGPLNQFTGRHDMVVDEGVYYWVKREPWIPGDSFLVPDHLCLVCRDGTHALCFGEELPDGFFYGFSTKSEAIHLYERNGRAFRNVIDLSLTWRCTCNHPSHQDDL